MKSSQGKAMFTRIVAVSLAAVVAWFSVGSAHAQSLGTAFTYQGELRQGGVPATGTHHLRFQLWDAPTGGTQIGSDIDFPAVSPEVGRFTVPLDFGSTAFSGSARWLQVQVITNGGGTVTTLVPRQAISATPYALYAASSAPVTAGNLPNGGAWSIASPLSVNSGLLHLDPVTNRVGIGTASPQHALEVKSNSSANVTHAILGELTNTNGGIGSAAVRGIQRSTSGFGIGVYGSHDGTGYGMHGDVAGTNGIGVFGVATNPNGSAIGVRGTTNSPTGYAGYFTGGRNYFGGRVGIWAVDPAISLAIGTNTTGIETPVSNTLAIHTNGSERMRFSSVGNIGIGTTNPATRLQMIGGTLHAEMTDNNSGARTILGWATATTGDTRGVYGRSDSNSGSAFGVYGLAPATGWGVYALGRLGASGTKSFRIDHPLDPANKFLMHYCAESPEPLNIYSGNETTDDRGYATVTLPAYFEAINTDVRYQLTIIDDTNSDDFVLAKVAREVRDNSFVIRTSQPHIKVSWRIEAKRNDAWVRAYGAPVEVDKPADQQGLYQNPELFNMPASKAIEPPMSPHPEQETIALEPHEQ